MAWLTFNGQEIGPFATCITQSGSALGGVGLTGSVNGSDFTITNADLAGQAVEFRGSVTGNQASGTLTISGSSLSGTFRMQPFTPSGALTMTGSAGGVSPVVNASIASGRREYRDTQRTQLTDLEVAFDDGLVRAHVTFGATGFGLGQLTVGASAVTAMVSYETAGATIDRSATSGTVTITQYDGTGMAGSYSLTLSGGGSVSGTFDVAWDLEAFQP